MVQERCLLSFDEEDGAGGVKNLFICMLYHGLSVGAMGGFARFCHVILLHAYSGISEIYRRFLYFFFSRYTLAKIAVKNIILINGFLREISDAFDITNTEARHTTAIPKNERLDALASFHVSPYFLLIS